MLNIDYIIKKNLIAFGCLPTLLVIEFFIDKENYEMCADIWKVYKKFYEYLNINVPDKFNKKALEDIKTIFYAKFGLSGNIMQHNIPFYANIILKELEHSIDEYDKLTEFDNLLLKCLNTKPYHKK